MRTNRVLSLVLAGATGALSAWPLAAGTVIPNWPVPKASGRSALADLSGAVAFIPVTPCRLVDTRGNGAPLTGGFLGGGASRNYTLAGAGTCGIPSGGGAISVNVTVVNTAGAGFLQLYPLGGSPGGVSTINYVAGQVLANAAIVPMDTSGRITVTAGVSGTDFIIDTNGYFGTTPVGGSGFKIFANTGNYGLQVDNTATVCSGTCGIFSSVSTQTAGGISIEGDAAGNTANNFGVYGYAAGTGGSFPPVGSQYSAGVYGKASSTTGEVAGVIGETVSNGAAADGVLGIASLSGANGGQFYNTASTVGVYLATGLNGLLTAGGISGGTLSITGAKSFISPHPEDPSKEIKYISVEAPTADVYFRGTGHLVGGVARIDVPDHFRVTAREDSYMTTVTPVGSRGSLFIESEGPDGIVVRGSGDGAFHYVVYAERDVMRDHQAVQANVDFTPEMLAKVDSVRFMPERMQAILVRNGTMNPDGSFNETTARRLGWKFPTPSAPAAPAAISSSKP